ncbi:MAG: hypothetical protein QOD05_374 [Microbacteriaceae bacterium]|nr:hypothetical protein [Microbacteriaceae bacterium]
MPDSIAPTSVPEPRRRRVTLTFTLIAALVVGGAGGVLIGRTTAANVPAAPTATYAPQIATGGSASGGQAGAGFTTGTIVSINGTTIVVKAADGTQTTIATTASTKVTQTSTGSVSTLRTGQTIAVVGTADSSGNVTATTVAEGAGLRSGFGG